MIKSKLFYQDFFKSFAKKRHLLKLGVVLAFLFISTETFATHGRYGTISYETISETGSGASKQTTVKFTINQGWRRSWSSWNNINIGGTANIGSFNFGDGTSGSLVLTATAINAADDWFVGTGTLTHTYTGNVDVTAFYASCCRISTLQDGNNDKTFRNEAVVTLSDQYNDSPRSSLPAVLYVQSGLTSHSLSLSAIDPNGHTLSYAAAPFAKSFLNSSSIYSSVNSSTGIVTLNTVGATVGNLHAMQFIITDSQGATAPIDFIVRIVGNSNPPQVISPTPISGTTYKVQPGNPVSFSVAASDVDAGDLVTILGSGIPVGATFLPGTPSNPMTVPFSWTPTLSDIGTYAITFSATDNNYVQTLTSINIVVSLAPVFDVPPSPVVGIHNDVVPGTNLSFTVQATDPDVMDVCQIVAATGKDMMNNPIPLYAGVNLTPALPSASGNTTSIGVSWTPTLAQWGHKHMIFTARDSYFDETTHEVSILVNTPPSFSSTAPSSACAEQLFTYNVVTTDLDIPQGDSIDIFAINMPSWMTFVDNGDGTGTLSGTPGAGDVGLFNMSLSAQDVHHHNNGTTNQNISINVASAFTVEITPLTVNTRTWGSAVSDPYTFYFGLSNTKKLRSSVTGGVGPFTYNWGTITSGQIQSWGSNPNRKKLLQPMADCKVYLNVTDQSTNCVYGDTIDIIFNDDYFCGTIASNGNITFALEVCEGGITKCVPWTRSMIQKLKSGIYTLGACGPTKQQLASTLNVKVFPNPATDQFSVSYTAFKQGYGSIRLMDSKGSVLTSESFSVNEGDFVHTIDASEYRSGLYLVHLEIDGEVFVERVVIQ